MTPAERSPLVSVVIVNYNGAHLLEDCLKSVLSQAYRPMEVIIVDNGSTDRSVEVVKNTFPAVRLICNESNVGFAGGNNTGVAAATGNYIVLLNNDTRVETGWLQELVAAVSPARVAAASSLILTEGIPSKYYETNGSVNLLGHNIMRKFSKPQHIFFAGGASMVFKKDLLGVPFDGDYFAYAEDLYLSLRARFAGYEVIHSNASVVHHVGSVTAKLHRKTFTTFLQERNRLLNLFLFFSRTTVVKVLPLVLFNVLAKIVLSLVSRQYSLEGLMRAWWWFPMHWSVVLHKRRGIRKHCTACDADVTSWMTADLTNGESRMGRFVNQVSRLYHNVVGITTLESLPPGSR